jgi:putative tryptophan/tyrosine transport system substrate-binding protein
MQGVAHSLKIETKPIDIRESADIERDVSAFAQSPNSGMIIAVSAAALEHKDLIIKLATQHRLPVVYSYRVFVTHGGLMRLRNRHYWPIQTCSRLRGPDS